MSVSVLRIGNDIVSGQCCENKMQSILSTLFKKNLNVDNYVICDSKKDLVNSNLNFLTKTSNNLIIMCQTSFFEDLKNVVCEKTGSLLELNEFAKTGIDVYFKKLNQPATKQGVLNYNLPKCARCILNSSSEYVGYVFKIDDCEVFVLPAISFEIDFMFNETVLPILCSHSNKNFLTVSLKTFSISLLEIQNIVETIKKSDKINIGYFSDGLVCEILIRFPASIDEMCVNDLVLKVYERLGKYIWTDENKTLEDIVCDILKVQNKTISIFEDCSFGTISKKIINSKSFENVMLEKSEIIATDNTKKVYADLNLNEEDFINKVLENNSFENNVCLISLKSKFAKNEFYVGIRFDNQNNIYKIKLMGESDEISNKLYQTCFYYLIKKLKQKCF